MNNILFCKELVTSGMLADNLSDAQLGFYDLDTLELTDSVAGKDFGIIGSTYSINGVPGVIDIGDVHPLNVVCATLPLNVSYTIVIEEAESEEEEEEETEPDASDVEILVIHKNADTTRPWRHFITIPYAYFNGDTETLMGLINDKFEELIGLGQIEIAQSSYSTGTLTLFFSNNEQYEIKSKSSLISITGPTNYLPITLNKIDQLLDKNIASFGIWNREEDDDWYQAVGPKVVIDEYDTIITIRYISPRKNSITHGELLYKLLHIICTSEVSEEILAMFQSEDEESPSQNIPTSNDAPSEIGDGGELHDNSGNIGPIKPITNP